MTNNLKVRVRVAPSPTGYLHIGTAQSALYNWLFARKNGGKFLLRIEDTDKERSTKEFEQSIYDALEWLDLKPDEPPVIQSANLSRHKEMLEKLLAEGRAFYCHHTKEELEEERKSQEESKEAPRHVCTHKLQATSYKLQAGIIRLAVDENSDRVISFDDQVRGKVEFKQALLGDFAIARAVDDPLYHFAVVVDDADMEITHVLRGEDHISNTPKQILIYEALGLSIPQFGHLPLILAPDRSKLSKRHGDTSALSYKKNYLPEAILNYLFLLSFTPPKSKISAPIKRGSFKTKATDQEIFDKKEMIKLFDLKYIHKSGAIFDVKKLNWINSSYVKSLNVDKFKNLVGLQDLPDKAIPLITERLEKLSDVQSFDYFWREPEYDPKLLIWKSFSMEEVKKSLKEVLEILSKSDLGRLRSDLDELGKKLGNRGLAYWPFRVALTGKEKSPDPVQVAEVLGKEKTTERVKKALGLLK